MDVVTRRFVEDRAANRCEYCHLPQSAAIFLRFHVEHIRAKQHVSDDSPENLALACPDCNRHKGPNLVSIDPYSQRVVALYNPRMDHWESHFVMQGAEIIGLTATGRATMRLLRMNDRERVQIRAELLADDDL